MSDVPSSSPRPSSRVLFIVVVFVAAIGYAHSLRFPLGVDQGIFSTAAHGILSGQMIYKDIWDFKPPIIHYMYSAAFFVFGESVFTVRVIDFISYVASIILLWTIAVRMEGQRTALISSLLFMLVYSLGGFWHTAQAESFSIPFILLYLLFLHRSPKKTFRTFFTGVLLSLIIGLKFSSFLLVGLLWMDVLLHSAASEEKKIFQMKLLGSAILGLLFGLAVIGVSLYFIGSLKDFVEINRVFLPQYISVSFRSVADGVPGEFIKSRNFIISAGLLIFFTLPALRRRGAMPAFTEIIIAGAWLSLISIVMQGKAFAYHFYIFLPFMVLLAGIVLSDFASEFHLKRLHWILAIVLLVLHWRIIFARGYVLYPEILHVAQNEYWKKQSPATTLLHLSDVIDVSEYMKRHTSNDEKIFLWGMQSEIYFLSRRYPPTRFIYDLPLVASFHSDHYRAELLSALQLTRPSFIIVESGDINPEVTGQRRDSKSFLKDFPGLDSLISREYIRHKTIGVFDVYKLP